MTDDNTTEPETFTAEQLKEASDNVRRGMAGQLADKNAELSELLKEKEDREAAEKQAEEQKLIANQEYEKALKAKEAEFAEFKAETVKAQKELTDKTLNLTLENAGMSDPLARAGAVAMYDGTDSGEWLAALKEANPNSFIEPNPNAVNTSNAPAANVNSGPSGIVTSEAQAEVFEKSNDPAQRKQARDFFEAKFRGL